MDNKEDGYSRGDYRYHFEWIPFDAVEIGSLGHGIEILTEERHEVLAFVNGFDWLHSRTDIVRVHLYLNNIARSQISEDDIKRIIVEMIECGSLKHGAIGHGLQALING